MTATATGTGRVLGPWNLVGYVTLLWVHIGVGLTSLVLVKSQSTCSSEMCGPPQSTISTQSISTKPCYAPGEGIILHCNSGFKLGGDNYTARCNDGVWTPDSGCRLDLFVVVVAASATMVAIFIFFLCFLCIYQWKCKSSKRKQHDVSKVKGEKKKRAGAKATNGQTVANGHVEDPDVFENDFTDDEEEAVVPNQDSDTRYDDNIYQNEVF